MITGIVGLIQDLDKNNPEIHITQVNKTSQK